MLDMQVIEALYLKDEEPHDYLHIKHERTLLRARWVSGLSGCVPECATVVEFLFSEPRITSDRHRRRIPFAVTATPVREQYTDGSQRVKIPATDSAFVMTKQ
jgi:hypothetical protein